MTEDTLSTPTGEKSVKYAYRLSFDEFADRSEHYADLLHSRHREVRLAPEAQAYFAAYPDTLHFVAIVTEDTPDTLAVLPVLARIVQASSRFDLRIVSDEYAQRSDAYAIPDDLGVDVEVDDLDLPLLLIFDEEWHLQDQWGPQPEAAAAYIDGWLARHPEYETLADDESVDAQEAYGELLNQLVFEMRCWYNSELAAACAAEIRALLSGLEADQEEGEGDDQPSSREGGRGGNTTKD